MEQLQKMVDWLSIWLGQETLKVDDLGPEFGCALFPLGLQVLHRQEDVAGNCYVRNRYRCQLRYVTAVSDGAAWLEALAQWVQQQSALGNNPGLGDIAQSETVSAEKGRLLKRDPGGSATYGIDLIAEYTKIYKAEA